MAKRNYMTHNTPAKIVVVGIGGGGVNAVNHMITCGMQGVEFVAVDTDKQQLLLSKARNRIQIGENLTEGLDAGNFSEFGQKAAEESRELLIEQLQGSDMVVITAGMGGNTGTGAAFIVAEYAKEAGALTIGVATKPFSFEGKRRMNQAEAGIINLKDRVDTLIVIPDDRLLQIIDRRSSMKEAFHLADDIVRHVVQGITDLLVAPGYINPDFDEVHAILANAWDGLIGIGTATGENAAQIAMESAIKSPLLEASIEGAKGLLLNIAGGKDLSMNDISKAVKIISETVDEDAHIIFGAITNSTMAKDEVQVTIVAVTSSELLDSLNVCKRKVCANCKNDYIEGDRYCKYCGAPLGKPDYIHEIRPPLYGPPPAMRFHECPNCGYVWKTYVMIDKSRYCPKCGSLAPASKEDK